MEKIIIIGGGGHAKVLISILKSISNYEIAGYTNIEDRGAILGVNWLGNDSVIPNIMEKGINNAVLGIGQVKNADVRRSAVKSLKPSGISFPVIISPNTIVSKDVTIGEGTVIMDAVIIHPGSSIGKFGIINTSAVIEHDCIIGDFVHIAPAAILNGGVIVGKNCLIGSNATIIQYRTICDNCIIGAGAVVAEDIIEKGTYTGVPAKKTIM
jgi:sugar O-acyltransferase (sialic acid O-acetyltransferase NeuD family)